MVEEKKIKKIRCRECGNIIAYQITELQGKGEIQIMCNHRKPNGKKCKTVNAIKADDKAES